MASHSVVFFRTYAAEKPQESERDTYQGKRPMRRPGASWLKTSEMTCRDFTKDSYAYRDLHYQQADKGWRFPVPSCANNAYHYEDTFSQQEFRKTDLGSKKFRNEKPTVNSRMRASSTSALTYSHIESPSVPSVPRDPSKSSRFQTEYRSSYRPTSNVSS